MEILKQRQYHPVDVVPQVMILYAASSGHLDDIDVESVRSFEKQFYAYMDDHYPEIGKDRAKNGRFQQKKPRSF